MKTVLSPPLLLFILEINFASSQLLCSSKWGTPKEEWSFNLNPNGGRGSIGLMGDVNDVLQGIVHKTVGETDWDLAKVGNPIGLESRCWRCKWSPFP